MTDAIERGDESRPRGDSRSTLRRGRGMLGAKQESLMAFVTIDVEPEPNGGRHFAAVVRHNGQIIGMWIVESRASGEQEVLYALEQLIQKKTVDQI
jgi:hypothetical protein